MALWSVLYQRLLWLLISMHSPKVSTYIPAEVMLLDRIWIRSMVHYQVPNSRANNHYRELERASNAVLMCR